MTDYIEYIEYLIPVKPGMKIEIPENAFKIRIIPAFAQFGDCDCISYLAPKEKKE
jgi:hypothetical protein